MQQENRSGYIKTYKFRTVKFGLKRLQTKNISNKVLSLFFDKFSEHFGQNHRLLITQNYFTEDLFSIFSGKNFTSTQRDLQFSWFLPVKYSDFWISIVV